MRIMPLCVLIIEKLNSNFKRPSILISEGETSFSIRDMPKANFWLLFNTMSWIFPNLNSCQMSIDFT